jgi:integrase
MKTRLTQTFVNSIKHNPQKPQWITDSIIQNLRLYVGTSGKKVWYVRYLPDGKEKTHKLGTINELSVSQARDAANDFMSRMKRGEVPEKKKPSERLLLGDFFDKDYEKWATAERKSGAQTVYLLRSSFKQFLTKPISALSIKVMEKWRQDKMYSGTKAATCNRRLTALKAALNWGVKRECIEANPLASLEKLKEIDSDIKVRYLTDDERTRLMDAIDIREKKLQSGRKSGNEWRTERGYELLPAICGEYADYMKPMILISLNTGIRQGSLFALTWDDIDFGTKTFTLRAKDTKGQKTLRLPMNKTVVKVFSSWREQCPDHSPGKLLFPSPKTGRMLNNVKKAWKSILEKANIKNFRWHDMRHDFASQLVMRGVDINTVRELMGHSDIKMTLRYAHLAPENKLRAVEILD